MYVIRAQERELEVRDGKSQSVRGERLEVGGKSKTDKKSIKRRHRREIRVASKEEFTSDPIS